MTESSGHGESWKTRACPGKRDVISAFSLRTGTTRILIRRISMWTILILRVIVSICQITQRFFGLKILGLVMGVMLAILNLVFITWCLAMIDRAGGYRHVFCLRVGRTHLDIFLAVTAVFHIALVSIVFSVWWQSAGPVNVAWFTLWGMIAFYGLVSCRMADSAA